MSDFTQNKLLKTKDSLWNRHREKFAWFILILNFIITLLFWDAVNDIHFKEAETRFAFRTEGIRAAIEERMMTYEQVLRSGIGLFKSSEEVTRSEWKDFVKTLQIENRYPGIQGIGFSLKITPEQKEEHIRKIREEGFPDYKIKPEGEREEYTSIIYLEPFTVRNQQAFGYDMFSQSVRRQAMTMARDTGDTIISGKVILVQEIDDDVQSGFLVYLPLYKKGQPVNTPEQRREALVGYVYSPFRAKNLMLGILGSGENDIHFEVYDGNEINSSTLMYKHTHEVSQTTSNIPSPLFEETKILNLYGHQWSLRFTSLPDFDASIESDQSIFVLALGGIFSLLCFIVIRGAFTTRRQALQFAKNMSYELEKNVAELELHQDHLEDLVEKRTVALKESQDALHHADKLSTLGKLVGSVAHEFNNPLYGVINIVEELEGDHLSPGEREKYSQVAKKECWRMAKMIKNLQDFYKPSEGIISSINLHNVVDEVLVIIGKDIKNKGIKVTKNYIKNLSRIKAVEDQIKQVVINLVQNSADSFSESSGGDIIFSTEQNETNVSLTIQDNGKGIAKESLKVLFEPFYTTKGIKGTGLGLSVSYGIIKKHGGDIQVESELGIGTTFTITLPVKGNNQ